MGEVPGFGSWLPPQYQTLAHMFHGARCPSCPTKKAPTHPALCLFCGRLVCCASSCCSRTMPEPGNPRLVVEVGECNQHARACGGGTGVFLMIGLTTVLVIRNDRGAFLPSVYLDGHGEEDRGLKRGRPLYLSRSRYQSLRELATNASFDHDTRVLQLTSNLNSHSF
eukprot:NODE_2194_length_820_cov_223.428016_g1534_i0.p1 GENE.NODE_2194_length_820_cov_223.428016_g1534_i0~~NODE_2194_length_820_cov_223.428016_g1534_i0.p1  ORF type:complete len:167 (+),score=46.36 NODE_2194_length_820_cov_223.428016_g1534_i0:33-533(+)